MSLLAFAVLCFGPAAPAPAPAVDTSSYVAEIGRYRRGDAAAAVQGLLDRAPGEVARQAEQVRARLDHGPSQAFPVAAALMLHTEAALLARQRSQVARFDGELAQAEAYGELLARRPGGADFVRRWRLALGYQLMGWADGRARRFFLQGLRPFPLDPALHLALGQVAEAQAELLEERQARPERRASLAEAERHYRRALEGDPRLEEAHLRLGRVLMQTGRLDQAASELQGVLGRAPAPGLLYLAHLFQGRLHEEAGRLDEAVRSYRQAAAADPGCQTAHLALGHALEALGHGVEAAEAWRRAAAAGAPDTKDPWWLYPFGEAHSSGALIDLLRAEARP